MEIIAGKLDSLTVAILSGTKMAREAMSDLLKFTFNLLLHYPKVRLFPSAMSSASPQEDVQMVDCEPQNAESQNEHGSKVLGDFWSSKLDGCVYCTAYHLELMYKPLQVTPSSSTHVFYPSSDFSEPCLCSTNPCHTCTDHYTHIFFPPSYLVWC